jgi:poly-gamma-glutamate capsule biosynthesis protein CapA/YwtB (metallophosphatase superfamily)
MARSNLSLVAVGDLVPTRRLWRDGVPANREFAKTVDRLHSADVVFGDLEMPLSARGTPREKLITFRADPAIAEDLRLVGFDILSLANNHSMDFGEEALLDTVAALDSHGIRQVGAGRDIHAATTPVVTEVNGWKLGFAAWSCLLPVGSAAGERRAGHAPLHVTSAYEVSAYHEMEEPAHPPVVRSWPQAAELQSAVQSIAELRNRVDFLAASVHWGYGFGTAIAEYQPTIAHALIDAGADIVIGNHVHVIHAVEVYKGRAILYSPGSFISQQPRQGEPPEVLAIYDQMSPDGYLATAEMEPGGRYQLRLTPITMDEEGLPILAEGVRLQRIVDRLELVCSQVGTRLAVQDGTVEVQLG